MREGGSVKVEERGPEHLTYLLEDTPPSRLLPSQLLVVSLSPHSPSIPVVPCTLVEEGVTTTLPNLGLSRLPSFLLDYPRTEEFTSHNLLQGILGEVAHNGYQPFDHPDTRRVGARLTLREADSDCMNRFITIINGTKSSALRAGLWDELHQDNDDAFTRTVLCKAGLTPDLSLLLRLDPKIQFRVLQQGSLRLYSQLPTSTLVDMMKGVNAACQSLDSGTYTRGERNPFQAVFDADGITWVGSPATAPPRRDQRAWTGRGLSNPALTPVSKHRIIITGPAPNWTDKMIKTVLTDLGVGGAAS